MSRRNPQADLTAAGAKYKRERDVILLKSAVLLFGFIGLGLVSIFAWDSSIKFYFIAMAGLIGSLCGRYAVQHVALARFKYLGLPGKWLPRGWYFDPPSGRYLWWSGSEWKVTNQFLGSNTSL
jgi:hypothetical protein